MYIELGPTEDQSEMQASCKYPRVRVALEGDEGLTLDAVIECLVRPALLAFGYSAEQIDVALGEGEGEEAPDCAGSPLCGCGDLIRCG